MLLGFGFGRNLVLVRVILFESIGTLVVKLFQIIVLFEIADSLLKISLVKKGLDERHLNEVLVVRVELELVRL